MSNIAPILVVSFIWTALLGAIDAHLITTFTRQKNAANYPTTTGFIPRSEIIENFRQPSN